jgi:methylthioribose-1-phosphate isomerase
MGADRIALNGDTAKKWDFEKAIVAKNFGVPFLCRGSLVNFRSFVSEWFLHFIEHRPAEE